MSSKAKLLFVSLLVGAASLPGIASAASLGSVGKATASAERIAQPVADSAAAKKKQAAALKKQQQAAALKKKQAAEGQEKKDWYEDDRDRGLDIAEKYAPNEIKRVKKNNYIAKGDSVDTGSGKKGWQQYMDKYYKR